MPAAYQAFGLLVDTVAAANDETPAEDSLATAQQLWATLFGLAALHLNGQLPDDADGLRLSAQAARAAIR